ncbi:MAG: extracellular solute-binding protein [Spirochaetaceae bacterium]|jgi:oligogalacturonide transport system substrate-binding protein|nr:extracellular solute-binding protein [Spirochaetaceae bacterium]
MKKLTLFCLAALVFGGTVFAAAKADSGTTLRFSWWGGDSRHQATLKVIELYQQKNPGVKIEAEYGGWDGYREKLVTQIAGGTAPDIMQIDQPWLFELSSMGEVFLTIDSSVPIDTSKFDKNFLNSYCLFQNQVKGLPTGLNGETFLVNTALLRKAGVDPNTEWNWDNLFTEGKKVSALGPRNYLLAIDPALTRFLFQKYMNQIAGGMIDENKNILFTEQQAASALTLFKRLLDEKVLIPYSDSSLYYQKPEENPEWINGNLALMHAWVSNQDRSGAGVPGLTIKSLPVMPNAKDSGILVRPSQILTINKNSKNTAAAAKFVDFFFNDPEAAEILNIQRGIPPTSTARELLASKKLIAPLVEEGTNVALAHMGKPQTVWEMNTEIVDILEDCIGKMAFGQTSPAQAAKEMRDRIATKLASL